MGLKDFLCKVGIHEWTGGYHPTRGRYPWDKSINKCVTVETCFHCKKERILDKHEWVYVVRINEEYDECTKCGMKKNVSSSY